MDDLFSRLATADAVDAARLEREIEMRWAQSGSPSVDLLLKRARDAMEAGKTAEAIEHYTALTDHAPGFAEGWYGRATAFFESGRVGMAVADLERALAFDPRHYKAIFGLGVIFETLNRHEEAFDAFGLVLQLHPNHEGAAEGVQRLSVKVNGVEL
ncbi:MAG: hypothetical protein CSA70_11085 [Rhodobacterales bacterium]|nr:MAG: hypothetical protein CSA70_11085 [Rhodobacterales bacterium]